MATEKTCFVIAPIGESGSEIRKRSDQIMKHIVIPAAEECGYKAIRADDISEPGIITSQVIQHIMDDPLVLADLTTQNPNVFYELAIRHAIKKPLVQIIERGDKIPFDVAGMRTIPVDHHDLDSVEEARVEIVKQIKSVEKDASQIDTPISVALDFQSLKQSGDLEQMSIADTLQAISELRSMIISLSEKVDLQGIMARPPSLRAAYTTHERRLREREEAYRRRLREREREDDTLEEEETE